MIIRIIQKLLKDRIGKGKAILLVGPRQVGKSTLLKSLQSELNQETLLINCDEPDMRQMLENVTSDELKVLIGRYTLVMIDEAQKVENIGTTLKLIVDNINHIQVIATGSSAFELRNKTNEPLTGRKFEFNLFPFSIAEMVQNHGKIVERRMLERRIVYGLYNTPQK